MKYLLIIVGSRDERPLSPEEQAEEMQAWFGFNAQAEEAGVLLGGEALVAADQAVTVDNRTGLVTDGPYSEAKEVVGGFYLLDVPDRDTALEWAKKIPPTVTVEVRACMTFDDPGAAGG